MLSLIVLLYSFLGAKVTNANEKRKKNKLEVDGKPLGNAGVRALTYARIHSSTGQPENIMHPAYSLLLVYGWLEKIYGWFLSYP